MIAANQIIGLPAQSTIEPPRKGTIPNSQRPSNPFSTSHEPDWVILSKNSRHRTLIDQQPKIGTPDLGKHLQLPLHHNVNSGSPGDADPKKAKMLFEDTQKRIPSSASSATSSKAIRKPGPPVPRKPSLLSSSRDLQKGLSQASNSIHLTRNPATTEVGRSRLSKSPRSTVDLPKTSSPAPQFSKPSFLNRSRGEHANVFTPPHQPTAPIPIPVGLMDEDSGCANTIPSLEPLR